VSSFDKDLGSVKLSNGETLVLPRLTLGRIISASSSISALIKKVKEVAPDLFKIQTPEAPKEETPEAVQAYVEAVAAQDVGLGQRVLTALPEVLPNVWDEVVALISNYLGKEATWVKTELDLEDVVKILFPFFTSIFAQGNQVVGLFNQLAEKKTTESTPG
jgi:hypothetical protein